LKTGPQLVLRVAALALVLACSFAAGCGGGPLTVKGNVSYDGKPVEDGSITFEPADGKGPALGGKIEGGHYEVSGPALPGKKTVRIIAARKTGRQIDAGPPAPKGTKTDEIDRYIPAIYNDKSTLTVDVVSGKVNEHDFPLKAAK